MRNTIITLAIATTILIAIPLITNAQTIGCCCDPVLLNGSFMTPADCTALGFSYEGPPPSLLVTCSDHCKAKLAPGPIGTCGDGKCQPTETTETCPGDCAPIVAGCSSPGYKPAPKDLNIAAVKGKKSLILSFTLPCPADYISIGRCQEEECTNFQTIAQVPPTTVFTDEDSNLEFNKDYTYSVIAHYSISGESTPATATGNAGDLECWEQKDETFCLNDFTYDQFANYLKQYGYAQYNGTEFEANFGRVIDLTFAPRFNRAWQCNNINLLVEPSPSVICDIRKKEYCVADETGARCATREPCNIGYDPFGLYATGTACETGILSRYCFFDKSTTTANKCYSCDPRMTCYDYKSREACERDNCGAGDCQWKHVFEDVGVGVCIDKRYNNCALCDKKGTSGMENHNASSEIWDACTEEKSNALSTTEYPCFFDKDKKTSKTCDEASCADYSALQCNSPADGIKLNPDNTLRDTSTDICEIGVCEYHLTTGCVKNADGNTGAGFQDCKYGNKTCEQDYFPPITTLLPTGVAGRVDLINIRIFDKTNKTSPPIDFAGKPGYRTYLCIQNETNTCSEARAFPISTTVTQLILKNGALKQGNKTLAKLDIGNNTITYYSRDAANNVEILQDINIYACDKCNGPTMLNVTVTGGRVIGKAIYTSAARPTFTFTFDEPTTVTFADISRPEESISLEQLTTGALETHTFKPISDLNGTYNFTINGHNDKNVYMEPPPSFILVVDPNLAGLNITPADGSIVNATMIDVMLNFTSPATLDNITLISESFSDPYAIQETYRDITTLFKTTDNKTFTAKVDKLTGGKYIIAVDAQGYNALDIYKQSSFFVATQKPGIRLIQPTFGVTAYSIFNISAETPLPSACKYVYDTPSPPSTTDFEFFNPMEGTNFMHTASGLTINYGDPNPHLLHVYCKFEDFDVVQRTFNLTLDPEPPVIVKAFAEPAIIAEQYIPEQELYVTTLKAQINKPGFCKYSLVSSSFPSMEGKFPGYDRTPKQSLGADVNVTEKKSYEYWITCKGKNQLLSTPAKVPFTVDLNLPLNVTSSTPQGFGTLDFTIGVVANKRVFCYFGEQEDDTTRCMGACTSAYTQWQKITVSSPGAYTYFVQCAHVSGTRSDIIEIPVVVDTTPPTMEYVKDEGSIEENPDITWSQSKIRVAVKANDQESGIDHYLITLRGQTDSRIIFKDYVSNATNGEPFYIYTTQNGSTFRLANNKRYKFIVKAVNKVGLESEAMESDGVLVDTSYEPGPCGDGEKNQNESDVDCGAECNGCAEGKKCVIDADCATNYCQESTCKVASCEDGYMNGLESDVDCGGTTCTLCEKDKSCKQHSDCATDYCDINTKTCDDAPPCADKVLSEGETDTDCGGPCERCAEGKTCQEHTDCTEGLSCKPDTKVCTSEPIGDDDQDGLTDDVDKCLGTPLDEEVDEEGCGLSQKFSLGDDINDKWRMDHFGCIECPEAAATADPDKDGLTNIEEYKQGTNPVKKDTDGDGWKDKTELDKGTSPTDSASHPPSIFLGFLWVLFLLLVLGGLGYGAYILLQMQKEKKKPAAQVERPAAKPAEKISAEEEIRKLKTFAKEEELPEKDWIQLEKAIKKKPLPPRKFAEALEKLRKIAHKERTLPEQPLLRLREMLEELNEEERTEIISKFKLFKAGLLSRQEIEELFRRLKITAEYYKSHKEELEKELEQYGRRRKKH